MRFLKPQAASSVSFMYRASERLEKRQGAESVGLLSEEAGGRNLVITMEMVEVGHLAAAA